MGLIVSTRNEREHLTRALQRQYWPGRGGDLLDAGGVAGADRAGYHRERGQNAVGRAEPMVAARADSPGVERAAGCANAGGDSAYGADFDSLSQADDRRAISGRGINCFDSSDACDYVGSGYAEQRRSLG